MTRQEQIQKIFDNFEPFVFEKNEKREMLNETIEEFSPFLALLDKSKTCKLRLQGFDRNQDQTYNLVVSEGIKRFILNMIEFQNKMNVDNDSHSADGNLKAESYIRLNEFFCDLFNRRIEMIANGGKIENDYFHYRLDEVLLLQNNVFMAVWYDQDEEAISIELL